MGSNLFIYAAAAGIALPFIALLVMLVVRSMMSENARRRVVAMRQSRRLPLILAIVVPAVFLLTISIILAPFGGSMLVRVLKNLPMAGMFAGMQFLALSRRPVGDRLRCSRCKYDLYGLSPGPSSGPSGRHDGKCPECGGQWGWSGGSEKAVKVWSWKWTAAGVILLLPLITQFASAPIMGVLWWEGALLRVVPTSSLVEEVLTQRSFTMAAWAELSRRTPSPADTDRIARTLLTRPAGSFYNLDEVAWLTTACSAKAIAPNLIEQRLKQLLRLTVEPGPSTGSVWTKLHTIPEQWGPFPKMEVYAVVRPRGAHGLVHPAVRFVDARTSTVEAVLLDGPFEIDPGVKQDRLRGTLTLILRPAGLAKVDVDGKPLPTEGAIPDRYSTVLSEGPLKRLPWTQELDDGALRVLGGLYRVDIPIDEPVESPK